MGGCTPSSLQHDTHPSLPVKSHMRQAFCKEPHTGNASHEQGSTQQNGQQAQAAGQYRTGSGHDLVLLHAPSGTVQGMELQSYVQKHSSHSLYMVEDFLSRSSTPFARVSASVTGDDPSVHGQQKQRSSQLEIKPQREGSAVAYGQLADAIRQAVKAVIFLISAGCTWDERMISGLRLALQFNRPVVLVHCVQSCPYPQSEEWPEDLRPFFSSQQPIKYVSQYFGVCTRLIMDMLDGKPINTEALGRPVLPGIDPVSPLVDPASKYVHLVTAKSDVERLVQAFAAASAAAQPPTAAPLSAFQAQAQIPDASSSSPGPSTSSAEARRAAAEKGPRAIRVPSATDESDAAASPATRTRSSSTGDSSCTGEGEGVNALDTNLEEVAVTMAPSPLAMQPLEPTESNVSALMPDAVAAVVAAAAAASGSGPHVLLGYAHDGWLPSVAVLQRQLEPQCSIHTQRVGRHSRAVAAAAAQANCTVASSNGGMLPVSEHPSMAANNSHVSSKAQLPDVLAVSSQVPNDASVSMQAAVNGLPPGAVQQGNQCSEAIATGAVLPVHNQAGPQQQQQSQNHALNQNQQPGKGTYVHFLSPSLRVLDGCFRAVLAAQESGLHVVLVCDASAGQHLQERPAHVDRAVWKVWRALWQDRLMYLSELHVPFLGLLCARLGLVQPGVPPDILPSPAVTPAHTLAHSNSKQPAAPGHAAVA